MSPEQETSHSSDERALTRSDLLKAAGAGAAALTLGTLERPGRASAARLANPPKRGGVLQMTMSDVSVTDNLDTLHGNTGMSWQLIGSIYDRMFDVDSKTWKVKPYLAQSITPNSDFTQYTIKVRPGVKFHDGKPVTADDFAYTIQRILTPSFSSEVRPRLGSSLALSGIEVRDAQTVVLHLTRPDNTLPITLSRRQFSVVQKDAPFNSADPSHAIGTGPFKARAFVAGQSFSLTRNSNYWQNGLPYLDGVQGVALSDQAAKVQAVLHGNAHLVDAVDPTLARTVTTSSVAKLIILLNGKYNTVVCDQTQDPFTDHRIYLALKYAIDREQILKTALLGHGTVNYDVPVPTSDVFYPKGYIRKRNINKAKQLLAAAGHPNGIDLTLYTSSVIAGMVDTAIVVAKSAAPAGFRIKINQWEPSTYWDQVWLNKPFYIANWSHQHPADRLTTTYGGSPLNEARYTSPVLMQILTEAEAANTLAQQKALYSKALKKVANESGEIIPHFFDLLWVGKKNLNGVVMTRELSADLRRAWLA